MGTTTKLSTADSCSKIGTSNEHFVSDLGNKIDGNTIDNQLLKAQMEIAKLKLHEDVSYNNLKSVITFSKYPLFYKLLQFSLTIPTSFCKIRKIN